MLQACLNSRHALSAGCTTCNVMVRLRHSWACIFMMDVSRTGFRRSLLIQTCWCQFVSMLMFNEHILLAWWSNYYIWVHHCSNIFPLRKCWSSTCPSHQLFWPSTMQMKSIILTDINMKLWPRNRRPYWFPTTARLRASFAHSEDSKWRVYHKETLTPFKQRGGPRASHEPKIKELGD